MATELTKTRIEAQRSYRGRPDELWVGRATGAGAIDHTLTPGGPYQLVSFKMHLNAAPTTGENLTLVNNANAGAAYDTKLVTRDLTVGSVTDYIWAPDDPDTVYDKSDFVDIDWANTDTKTWAIEFQYRLL